MSGGDFGADYFARQISDRESSRTKDEHELALRLMDIQAGHKVLDIGCGKGNLGFFLLSQRPGIEMVFSDVSDEAKKYLGSNTFVQCSMDALPFEDHTFDRIFCMHVIAHFPDGEKGMQEAYRVLKKGGKLMILTPNKLYVYFTWAVTFLKYFRVKYDRTAQWLYTRSKLDSQLKSSPWQSVSHSYFQDAPRLLPIEWMRAKLIAVATK